jgi:erythromycin esterase-like protein
MNQRNMTRMLAPAIGAAVLLTGTGLTTYAAASPVPAQAQTVRDQRAVVGWIERNAGRLRTVDPAAPLDDLAPVRRSIGNATIVGLGESVHRVSEETTLKHRVLRYLVERMGFRSVAWEEDWTLGVDLDKYIRTGQGDLTVLMSRMSRAWRTQEVADVLRWLRDFNAGRPEHDKVRFVGVEYYSTSPPAYDAIAAYVAKAAPARLPEVEEHLDAIKPPDMDMAAYVWWYAELDDKEPYIRHVSELYELVEGLPHRPGDRAYALTLQYARQVVWFYEHFALEGSAQYAYRDAHAARNLRWWRSFNGGKIAYWAASGHTAVAPDLRFTVLPDEVRFASVGSYLGRWYGRGYRSIGFTFDHGTVGTGAGGSVVAPPPPANWFERPFGAVRHRQFATDLRADAPAAVREWLRAPVTTRGAPELVPGRPYDSYLSGGTLAQWFDVIVHRQEVTASRPL